MATDVQAVASGLLAPMEGGVGAIHWVRAVYGDEGLQALARDFFEVTAERDKLQRFKDYVHARLDAAGVPVDPESSYKAEGCRIGGRLDWVLERLGVALHGPGEEDGPWADGWADRVSTAAATAEAEALLLALWKWQAEKVNELLPDGIADRMRNLLGAERLNGILCDGVIHFSATPADRKVD